MLNGSESHLSPPPRLILAHAKRVIAALIADGFRRLDWDVHLARTGCEARSLAGLLKPDAVLLHTDLPEESGWLTCDKLTREQPLARVILLSDNLGRRNQQLAVFVGASALVGCGAGLVSRMNQRIGSSQPRRGYEHQLGTATARKGTPLFLCRALLTKLFATGAFHASTRFRALRETPSR